MPIFTQTAPSSQRKFNSFPSAAVSHMIMTVCSQDMGNKLSTNLNSSFHLNSPLISMHGKGISVTELSPKTELFILSLGATRDGA